MPIYYPSAPSLAQAQPIVIRRGETVSGIDIMLGDGLPAVVTGIVVRSDGEPVANGFISATSASGETRGGFDRVGGTGIANGGSFRFLLPPGEYTLDAQAQMRQPTGPVPPDDQLSGSTRVVVSGGGRRKRHALSLVEARLFRAEWSSKAPHRHRRVPARLAFLFSTQKEWGAARGWRRSRPIGRSK